VAEDGRVALEMKVIKFDIKAKRIGNEWRIQPELQPSAR
jgi:hypothetical protein